MTSILRPLGTPMRALAAVALSAMAAHAAEWTIDPNHSAASFAVKHLMVSTVHGSFNSLKGTVDYDAANLASSKANLTIDVSTLDTRNEKRDSHLKSPDFFDVQKFPTITFVSKKVIAGSEGKFKLVGDMTMHGVTKEVTFEVAGPEKPIKDQKGTMHSGATANAKIDRKEFGLVWNRAIEGGGVTVGDEIDLTVEVELVQPAKS